MDNTEMEFFDLGPTSISILKEVIAGLSKTQKALPAKLLYDERSLIRIFLSTGRSLMKR